MKPSLLEMGGKWGRGLHEGAHSGSYKDLPSILWEEICMLVKQHWFVSKTNKQKNRKTDLLLYVPLLLLFFFFHLKKI